LNESGSITLKGEARVTRIVTLSYEVRLEPPAVTLKEEERENAATSLAR
jgi:hypothetical protein